MMVKLHMYISRRHMEVNGELEVRKKYSLLLTE
jgi:hypothetical protein